MRVFIGAVTALLVLIGAIVSYEAVLMHLEADFDKNITELSSAIEKEQKEKAGECILKMEKKWDSTRNLLMAFSEHSDLDKTEEHLKSLHSAYRYTDWQAMHKEMNVFSMLLKNGFDSSKPALANIL